MQVGFEVGYNDTRELNDLQFKYALALAGRYGHLWAHEWLDAQENGSVPDIPKTPDAISDWVIKKDPTGMAGILSPVLDEYSCVTHATGTGRLTWDINDRGSVFLKVYRPQYEMPVLDLSYFEQGADIMLRIPSITLEAYKDEIMLTENVTVDALTFSLHVDEDCGWNHPRDVPRFSKRHVLALQQALEAVLRADMPSARETIEARAAAILQPYRVLAAEEAAELVYITIAGDVFQYGTQEKYLPSREVHFVQTADNALFLVYRDGQMICPLRNESEAQRICAAIREHEEHGWLYLFHTMGRL